MKKRRKLKFVLYFLVAMAAVLSTTGVMAMNNKLWFQKENTTDVYVFPITPHENPDEWKKLESHAEMVEVTQIPEKILKNMSTRGLIETCLSYPLFGNIFAYNSYLQGMEVLNKQFNGFRELNSRKDAAKELLDYYKNIDYGDVINSNDPYCTLRARFLDFYMSQDEILLNLSVDERSELIDACVKTLEAKTKTYPEIFSIDSTLYLTARVMQIDDKDFNDSISNNDKFITYSEFGRVNEELAELVFSKLSERGYQID